MAILFENPLWIIFFGVVIEAVLGLILLRTGRGVLLWIMTGVLVVTLGGLLVERLVVTERERVEMTLDGITAALEANDLNRVLSFVAPEASYTQQQARSALGLIEVQSAHIYNLDININQLTSPPTARASFFGHLYFRDRRGQIPYNNYESNFIIDLKKIGEVWVVTGHIEEQNPNGRTRQINE